MEHISKERLQRRNANMKKIFFIHENTAPIEIRGKYRQLTTDYVVTIGFVAEDHEKDQYNPADFDPVYSNDGMNNVELENFLPGIFFKTYEEGCKVLTKILAVRCSHDVTVKESFNELAEKYPEHVL